MKLYLLFCFIDLLIVSRPMFHSSISPFPDSGVAALSSALRLCHQKVITLPLPPPTLWRDGNSVHFSSACFRRGARFCPCGRPNRRCSSWDTAWPSLAMALTGKTQSIRLSSLRLQTGKYRRGGPPSSGGPTSTGEP